MRLTLFFLACNSSSKQAAMAKQRQQQQLQQAGANPNASPSLSASSFSCNLVPFSLVGLVSVRIFGQAVKY